MKLSSEMEVGKFLFLLLFFHVRFFTYGQSTSHLFRPTSTLRSGVVGISSLLLPPHLQSTPSSTSIRTTIPVIATSSPIAITPSSPATSSSYLPLPTSTPTILPPTISLNISVQIPKYVFDREEVTFTCSVEPSQNVTFSWHSSDMIVLANTSNFTTILPGYFASSSLLYCCQVSNFWFQVSDTVCDMAPVILSISSVTILSTEQTGGTPTLLRCVAFSSDTSMNLNISYFWEYMGNSGDVELIQSDSRYSLSSDNRNLTITSRSITLSGRYYCSAYFTGHVQTTRNLSEIVQQFSFPVLQLSTMQPCSTDYQLRVEVGARLEVECSGTGYEIPDLSWLVDGVSPASANVVSGPRTNPSTPNGYVTEVGHTSISISIDKVEAPIHTLECVGTNNLFRSVTCSVNVFVVSAPCVPQSLRVSRLGESWAVVEWSNGRTCLFGEQDVDAFILKLREPSGLLLATFVFSVTSQSSQYSYNITGLASDSFYEVDVSGGNAQGTSGSSDVIILHTLAPSDTNIIMFPFGALPGDSLVPHGTYAQSLPINLPHPVPIGNRLSSTVYLSPLGVLSFDRPFHYWDVQQLGVGSILQDVSILAPFWSDIDYSSQGSLFYNLYSNSTPAHSQILSNATQLATQYANAPSDFRAATLLVATWSRVLPYSGAQNQLLQENSFQLGLAADHSSAYVLFGYKRDDVSWSATEQVSSALIGFSAASLLSETHPLSLTPDAHEIDSSGGRNLTVIGYNISYSADEIDAAQSECDSWSRHTSTLQVHAPSCPCTLLQARLDARFSLDRVTPDIPEYTECYISLFRLFGPNQRCCYTTRLQTVITGGRFRGSALQTNPATSAVPYLSGEYRGYRSCCIQSDSCEKYFAVRISDNCTLYQAPGFAWGFGLSHLITPDENELVFNGLGEYVLLEGTLPCPIQLQARTEQYPGTNATFFSALAFSESNCSSLLFFSLSSDRTQLKVYFNGNDVTASVRAHDILEQCVVLSNRMDAILVHFQSGFSLAAWAENRVLNFNLSLPRNTCYLRTAGLLGRWGGEENGLLLRNGTLLSRNASDEIKESFFQSWRLREDESLMRYGAANYSAYNPTEYEVSLFASDLFASGIPQEVDEQCSGKRACLFDQLVTGSAVLANSSRDLAIASFTALQEINALPPILSGSPRLIIHSGDQFSYSLSPNNPSPHSLMLSSFSPLRNTLLTFSEDAYLFQGLLSQDIGEFAITLSARDVTTGLTRDYSPTIFYCLCHPLECSLSPAMQEESGLRFYNLSCGCEKGFNITQGHICISSPECVIELDMYFVFDGIVSMGQSLDEELSFVASMMERFIYPPNTVENRVGYLVFSTSIDKYQTLSTDISSVISSLNSIPFSAGLANLSLPLDYMLEQVYTSRVLTESLIVYVTDELGSNDLVDVLMRLSEQLGRERGVRILVIGFGNSLDASKLRAIATEPDDKNYLAFSSLSQAQLNLTDITQAICQIVTLPTTPFTTHTPSPSTGSTPRGPVTAGSTPTAPTLPPSPPPTLCLVTLKFSLSYSTLLSLTQNDIPGFLASIVRGLDSKVPVGTISIAGGTIGVSFRVDKNEVDPAEVKSKLNSQLGILSPYLADVIVTDYSSLGVLVPGLAVYLFSYVIPVLTFSLTTFLLYIHFQCRVFQRGKLPRVKEVKAGESETEDSSELRDEVASVLEGERRVRITRPGTIIPSNSIAVEIGADRAGSESMSYYGMSSVSEIPLFKPKARIMSRPLSPDQISDLLAESPPYTIHLEFDALPMNSVSVSLKVCDLLVDETPPGTESKNRYPNVLAPPHSRVPLFLKYNQPTSDYINANFIRGYNMMSRAYIATQGPLYNTMDDFWRMIWEQRCEVIVMLTELVERGRHKCIHYWPDMELSPSSLSGDLEITPIDKDYKSAYILSRFKLKLRKDSENKEVREVVHFWFKQWPDYGIPETGIPMITLLLDSRTHARNSQSPVLMHCSSGAGRTGVFIALDIGMHELEKKGRADVLKIISLMRQDRGGMVQTKDQYLLVYKTLLAYSDFLKKAQQPDAD